jgi:hypothetical protein
VVSAGAFSARAVVVAAAVRLVAPLVEAAGTRGTADFTFAGVLDWLGGSGGAVVAGRAGVTLMSDAEARLPAISVLGFAGFVGDAFFSTGSDRAPDVAAAGGFASTGRLVFGVAAV